ncbi:MAG: Gfo/Idh/MocA family oxidoreductase [Sorangiineae bacterium]|nr:Gfo/Idh/MocA family oxidoreductase [Polyangiaceae bacterium]MEB2322327.1 Gfo/Idh/MocA family oxidoreductase [Sorangiineae bacterium]
MRILVVGHGLIGKQRARAVVELAGTHDVTLAGTVDPAPRPAELYGGAPHYLRLEDAPPASYDAAIIALPHDLAPAVALTVAAANRPFLIEKPFGRTADEARAIAGPARAESFVGYNYRFLPNVREALRRAASGELGRLRSADLFIGHGGHPRSAEGWKLDPVRAGGGALIDPGVHLLDLLRCLEPALEVRHAEATSGFWGTGVEEDLAVILGHGSLIATVRVSLVRWVNGFRVELVGEDGYALAEGRGGNYGPLRLRLGRRWAWNDGRGRSQRETEQVKDFGEHDPSLTRELEAVLARWTGRPPPDAGVPPATLADGLATAELCDAMYAALHGNVRR